ncbi:MAG: endonuclease III [Chloroflexi bacterium]|nr:endonuclease III [Chloroflexota bacterium]
MSKSKIGQIIGLLINAYGDRKWHKRLEPVGELVLTILSQNTSDTNSRRAYTSLIETFDTWDSILKADTEDIASAIRSGGLADVKAKYIKNALQALKKETTDFNLAFLVDMTVESARKWLIQLPGVGMKTASCVLLFSLGMPAFPVDTHVYRVAGRLGLIGKKVSVDAAHVEMERMTPAEDTYRCHVLLIEHGRKTCKAQRPLCPSCVLAKICPSYKMFVK